MTELVFWLAIVIFGGGSTVTLVFIIWRDHKTALHQWCRWIKTNWFRR